jgi:hypothetical protein
MDWWSFFVPNYGFRKIAAIFLYFIKLTLFIMNEKLTKLLLQ